MSFENLEASTVCESQTRLPTLYKHSANISRSKNPNDKSVFSGLVLSWSRFLMASEMANKNNNDKKLKLSVSLLLSRKRLLLQLLNSCEPLNYVFYMQQIAIIARQMVHRRRHYHPQLFFEILFGNCSIITVGNLDPRPGLASQVSKSMDDIGALGVSVSRLFTV